MKREKCACSRYMSGEGGREVSIRQPTNCSPSRIRATSSASPGGGVGFAPVQSELSNSICPATEPKQWPSRSKIMFRITQASVQNGTCASAGVETSAARAGRTSFRLLRIVIPFGRLAVAGNATAPSLAGQEKILRAVTVSAPVSAVVVVLVVAVRIGQVEQAVGVHFTFGPILVAVAIREREGLKPGERRGDLGIGLHPEALLGRDQL